MDIGIRPSQPGELPAIQRLVAKAFATVEHSDQSEPEIVKALHTDGALSVSLVALSQQQLIGYIVISPVSIDDNSPDWHGLGPVAVLPEWQSRGVGASLIREALQLIQADGAAGCVLLGDPAYYQRFGFAVRPGLSFPGAPQPYFQALSFSGHYPSGEVRYHPAFYGNSG